MNAIIHDKEWCRRGALILQLYYSDKADVTLHWTMYLQRFFYRQHIYIQAHSTDSVKNRQNGGTHDHLTAVCEYPAGPEVDDDLYGPSLYLHKWQWLVWKLRDRPGVFVHCWWRSSLTSGLPAGPVLETRLIFNTKI